MGGLKVPKFTKLKAERLKKEWPLWKVSSQLRISETLISKWENGQPCPMEYLEKLAEIYNVPVEELMEKNALTSTPQK